MEPPIATADRAGMSASRAATLTITLRSALAAANPVVRRPRGEAPRSSLHDDLCEPSRGLCGTADK